MRSAELTHSLFPRCHRATTSFPLPHSRAPLVRALAVALLMATACAAQAQEAPTTEGAESTRTLDSVVVTGSRIRRVDAETANPVTIIGREAIEATGKATLGDLIQELPAIAGNATNPYVNNGGGTGASAVSLRGLGDKRTLVLVNGVRLAYNDVNSIPAAMVKRVEVLGDGASAVYGSDAIGGVVNFILRDRFEGVQASADYGRTSRGDGSRRNYSLTAGHAWDRASVVAGVSYHKIDEVSAAQRAFSRDALNLVDGEAVKQGSSATPYGTLSFDDGSAEAAALAAAAGCSRVTLDSATGAGPTAQGDYHCYDPTADSYNYQPFNLLQTPQERTNAFVLGSYRLTDNVEAYGNAYFTKTHSASIIAPVPIFAIGDNFLVSADNYYNPFGINFGADRVTGTTYNAFNTRLVSLGNRQYAYNTYNLQTNAGLRGGFGDSSWQWDANFNYGRVRQKSVNNGFLNYAAFNQAVGPSFLDSDGVVKCGTAGSIIAGCTPINLFNTNDPATVEALEALVVNPVSTSTYTVKQFEANANGDLFALPAGTVNLAVGLSYRKESTSTRADELAVANLEGLCGVVEFCTTVLNGSFNVKEAYAETLIPLLADKPFVHAMNLSIGTRFSDYDSVGSTTNSKVALEWRPIENLLLRGTVSEVFRAPNINELYAGIGGDAASAIDPCNGYTGGNDVACENVPTDGSYHQADPQVSGRTSGALVAGYDGLKPETGKSYDFGVVYDPLWAEGLSLSADVWRINLEDTIATVSAQTVLNQCYANAASAFCPLIHRNDNGTIYYIGEPTVNLGKLWTKGVDFGANYRLPDTRWGSFDAGLNGTYVARYDINPDPTDPGTVVIHSAGKYTYSYGNFPRIRALGTLSWKRGPWSAAWRTRYVGHTSIGSSDARQNLSADSALPAVERKIGAHAYHSLQGGYDFSEWHTRVEVGVDNLGDKQPPLFYNNNANNGNTDVMTYDVLGRYLWARVTVTF